jgi:hypothetical protein
MANPEHLEILKQGVDVWNRWNEANNGVRPDLNGANLRQGALRHIIFRDTDLRGADFRGADLTGANMSSANLLFTNLSGVRLTDTDLSDVRRSRHVGDFRDWKNDDSYRKAFERLMRDLKAEAGR